MKRRICTVCMAVCLIAAAYFAYQMMETMKEYRRGDEDIRQVFEVRGEVPKPLSIEQETSMDEASRRAYQEQEKREWTAGYERLKEENQDVIGWIGIDGTVIDYPVMQTPEAPDYYLRRGFDKKYSVYGMIYMDASCKLDEQCPNYILYGHHMKNGSMFASIEKYGSREYYEEHPVIRFDTLEEPKEYEIVAAFKMSTEQMDNKFAYKLAARTEEDYGGLMEFAAAHAFYDTGVTAVWPQQLVTLTTCEYSQRDGRFFVIAREKL